MNFPFNTNLDQAVKRLDQAKEFARNGNLGMASLTAKEAAQFIDGEIRRRARVRYHTDRQKEKRNAKSKASAGA